MWAFWMSACGPIRCCRSKTYIVARENVFMVLEGSLDGRADLQAGDLLIAADVEFLHGAGDDVAEG
jgi:hypothetical protein